MVEGTVVVQVNKSDKPGWRFAGMEMSKCHMAEDKDIAGSERAHSVEAVPILSKYQDKPNKVDNTYKSTRLHRLTRANRSSLPATPTSSCLRKVSLMFRQALLQIGGIFKLRFLGWLTTS